MRTVQPVLEEFEQELEEAAATLGANRLQTITRVILPRLTPAVLTGFALAFARAVGEYGSVIFIAGNLPNVSEIAPLLIVIKLEEFDQAGASVIAAHHAGHRLRHAARHQPDPGLEPQEVRRCMSDDRRGLRQPPPAEPPTEHTRARPPSAPGSGGR